MTSQEVRSNDRKFMSLSEASDYMQIKKSTLYAYCHMRIISFYKVRNRLTYFLKSDLDDFILNESNLVKSAKQIEEEAAKHISTIKKGGKS